ncbi:MAG: hypothetical protein AB7O92_18235 [Acidimicrobiia bacterium]
MRVGPAAWWLAVAAALGLGCAPVHSPQPDATGSTPAPATSTLSSTSQTTAPGSAPATTPSTAPPQAFAVAGVLIEADHALLRVRAEARTDLPCTVGFTHRVSVLESADEVRLAVLGDPAPITAPPGVGVGCTGFTGPAGVLDVQLSASLAGRRLVDEHSGELRPVRRDQTMEPSPLPAGWVALEEQFTSTAEQATWHRRFQPDPLPVMVYGLDVTMSWGTDCQNVLGPWIHDRQIIPVEIRGLPAHRTENTNTPMLFWQEGDSCLHLIGNGSCNTNQCLAIDQDQLVALAESLHPPA